MNSSHFAKKVLYSQKIKSKNSIDGYCVDISIVANLVQQKADILNVKQKRRILNLYEGYQ